MTDTSLLVLEDFNNTENVQEDKFKKYQELLDLGGTFGQSLFSEEHFVIEEQITPHRKLRQALLHFDGKCHAFSESKANQAKVEAQITQISGDIVIINRIIKKINKVDFKHALDIPQYSCEIGEQEYIKHIIFDPAKIIEVYDLPEEWEDSDDPGCKSHLLREAYAILNIKKSELVTIQRTQMQQYKLIRDAQKEIDYYEKKIPELHKMVVDSGISAEEAERQYWILRNKRFIETKQIEQKTGIPADYLQSMGNLESSDTALLLEFAEENKYLLDTNGVPRDFRYKKHTNDYVAAISGPDSQNEEVKKLFIKGNAERNNQGNIVLGLLYRNEEDARRHGACDPENNLLNPRGYNVKPISVWGMNIDEARNLVIQKSLEANADWVFFVDDDLIIPKNALNDLLDKAIKYNYKVIGGEYSLKQEPYRSAAVVYIDNGSSISPIDENGIVDGINLNVNKHIICNGILPTGCMLISCDILKKIGSNWFQEYRRRLPNGTEELIRSDDYPFTQKCIEMNIDPILDPETRCIHVDFRSRKLYGKKLDIKYCINNVSNPWLRAGGERYIPAIALACPKKSLNDNYSIYPELLLTSKGCKTAQQIISPTGLSVEQAYTEIVNVSINNNIDYLFIFESDMIIPRDAMVKLVNRSKNEGLPFVCASYVLKNTSLQSTAINVNEKGEPISFKDPFDERGIVECNWCVPMGCCVIDLKVFADMPYPWFTTVIADELNPAKINLNGKEITLTETCTQDAFFCERLFSCGYKAYIDTDIQCLHVDKSNGRVFGSDKYTDDYRLKLDEAWRFAIDPELTKCIQTV